jgi:hypothetical protein
MALLLAARYNGQGLIDGQKTYMSCFKECAQSLRLDSPIAQMLKLGCVVARAGVLTGTELR